MQAVTPASQGSTKLSFPEAGDLSDSLRSPGPQGGTSQGHSLASACNDSQVKKEGQGKAAGWEKEEVAWGMPEEKREGPQFWPQVGSLRAEGGDDRAE